MKAEPYLEKIMKYDRMIRARVLDIEELKQGVFCPSFGWGDDVKVQTSKNPRRHESSIVYGIEKEEQLKREIENLWEERQKVIRTVELLSLDEYEVIYGIFVRGFNIQEVADMHERSYSWAAQTKHKGIKNLQKILDEIENGDITSRPCCW